MKKLIIVANDGRQTGKTAFTRVLEQFYQRKGIEPMAIYTDASAAPDESAFWDLEEDLTPARLEAYLEETDALIVDISTGRAAEITEFFTENEIFDTLLDLDTELCIATPIHDTKASIDSLVTLADGFADNAEYLVLHSPHPGATRPADWAGSYGNKVMGYLGAIDIAVPEFDPGMDGQLAEHDMDLATGLCCRQDLPRFLRDALHKWELSYSDSLEKAMEQLIPDTSQTRSVYA